MNRSLAAWLVAVFSAGVFTEGNSFGQINANQADSLRTSFEEQFDLLDQDQNGELSEQELASFSKVMLGRMRTHGLPDDFPISRRDFASAGVAQAELEPSKNSNSDHPNEDRPQVIELKRDFGKDGTSPFMPPESELSSPTGRRSPSGKSKFSPGLPAEYKARDKNGDGQIALYEWDRAKYAEFVKLDKNGDGFLTAAELVSKTTVVVRRGDGTATGASGTSQEAEERDPIGKEARDSFGRMDTNQDGGLDEEEWAKSKRVRPMFENAGINATLPIDIETFVAGYRQAKAKESSPGNAR